MSIQTVTDKLRARGWHIATAESCTGGLIAASLTGISGASDVFECGFVTYSDRIKQQILSIGADTLRAYTVYSRQVAREMALSCARQANAEVGIGVTGVAGPSGGTEQAPVGTVFVCVAINGKTHDLRLSLTGTRDEIRRQTAERVFGLLDELLQ